jgi:hypothetical protein
VGIYAVMGLVGGVGALLGPGPRWYLDGRPATRPANLHRLGHAVFHGLRSHKPQRGMIPRDGFSIKANRLLIAVVNGTMLRLIMRIIILTGLSL